MASRTVSRLLFVDKIFILPTLPGARISRFTPIAQIVGYILSAWLLCPPWALAQVPVPSAEAQRDFASASKKLNAGDFNGAVPLFQRAIQHDENFAMAYMGLGLAYRNLKQYAPSVENLQKAYDLRDHAGDKEKLMIAANYHSLYTGDLDQARQAYEKWSHDYPQDSVPHNNLGVVYGYLGQYEKQRDEFLEAIRLRPESPVARANLVSAYSHLYLLNDAKAAYLEALNRKQESPKLHYYRYGVAFLEADAAEMQRQSAWTAGHPESDDILLSPQSDTEAFSGHLAKARVFSRRASESAQRTGDKEMAAWREMNAALREAEFGNAAQARSQTSSARALDSGQGIQILAALALARAGDSDQAQKLADDLEKQNPFNTTIRGYWLPTIRAAVELNRQNPSKAVEILQTAASFELGEPDPAPELGGYLYPVYLRGLAFLALRQGSAAAAEFQKFVDHRGVAINCPLAALARLGLARAYALQSDTPKARAAYQDFFTLWKDADPDIPVLNEAKADFGKLP